MEINSIIEELMMVFQSPNNVILLTNGGLTFGVNGYLINEGVISNSQWNPKLCSHRKKIIWKAHDNLLGPH